MKVLSLVTLAIAVAAVFSLFDPDSGLAIWRELRQDLDTSNARVEQLVRENEALRAEIAVLENEPAALDRAIREELDLVRPGEVVVRFQPGRPGDAGSAAGATGDDSGAGEAGARAIGESS
ncbi:MAG: septum formation initiator family protein [Myxococcota bacterium]